jgi:hypothetical protein
MVSIIYPTYSNTSSLILGTLFLLSSIAVSFSVLHSVLAAFGFLASLTSNRIIFSPLNRFKGPSLAKVSKLWSLYSSLDGKYHKTIDSLFTTYNEDWIRTGPNEITCRDVDAIKVIYGQSTSTSSTLDNTAHRNKNSKRRLGQSVLTFLS